MDQKNLQEALCEEKSIFDTETNTIYMPDIVEPFAFRGVFTYQFASPKDAYEALNICNTIDEYVLSSVPAPGCAPNKNGRLSYDGMDIDETRTGDFQYVKECLDTWLFKKGDALEHFFVDGSDVLRDTLLKESVRWENEHIKSGDVVNGVEITVNGIDDLTRAELLGYMGKISKKLPEDCNLHDLMLTKVPGTDDIDLDYHFQAPKFDRIRRITGYLVGTIDRWNDAKRAEEKDRVKHGLSGFSR